MLHCAILDDYQDVGRTMTDWSRLTDRVQVDAFNGHISHEDELVLALESYEIIVAMRERTPFPRSTLERLPNLKLLITTGMGNAAIDVRACKELGITLCGTGGSQTSTAELTWALILAAARGIVTEVGNVRSGGWMTTLGTDLEGRTLGLLGLGRLGGRVATIAKAFGMRTIAWSQNLTPERCAEMGVEYVSKEELLRQADFLSIHVVLSDRTRGLLGASDFALMKPTAWLINTSRGPICDEDALARACTDGTIAGAAIDTFGTEPLPIDHPFRELPNVLATPHIGYVTHDTYREWFDQIAEDIEAYINGAPKRLILPRD